MTTHLDIAEIGFIDLFLPHNTEYLLLCYDTDLHLSQVSAQDIGAGGRRGES